jgi:hypothetical protein
MRRLASFGNWGPLALLVLVQVSFRLPAYFNAGAVHSDAAVVGLQARHILAGEWSWFLWGAGYQASFDALLSAAAFAVLGSTPRALMLMPLLGYLLFLGLVYDLLRRRLDPGTACILSLILGWMPAAHALSYFPPRQWAITVVFLAIWLVDGTAESRHPLLRNAAAGLLGVLSLYLDLFALQLGAGFALFGVLCAFDVPQERKTALHRCGALAVGAAAGLVLLWLVWQSPESSAGKARLSLERVGANFRLLAETCLPMLVGVKVFVPGKNLYPDLWNPPVWFRAAQLLGALLYLGGLALGALLALRGSIPWPLRRLGVLGFVVSGCAVGGFLLSIMPSDLWTTRYLAPITLFAPFALAPVAYRLGRRLTALGLLPYLVASATSTWLLYGSWVRGPLPVFDPRSSGRDEAQLCHGLRALGIHQGSAQYWLAYRLTFLCEEDPVFVPLAASEDRYAPYRQEYNAAPVVALVFHPSEPRAKPEEIEPQLRSWRAAYVRAKIAGYTVLIWQRSPIRGAPAEPGAGAGPAAAPGRSP